MNKTVSGFLVLSGIIGICVGGYFVVKKFQEKDICEEELMEEEEAPTEMPLRGSESDSKTRSTEPINLESYKSFLDNRTAYTSNTIADVEARNFGAESAPEKTPRNFFDILDSIPESYCDGEDIYAFDNGGHDVKVVLYYNNGAISMEGESYLKDEDMNILDNTAYMRLKNLLDSYSRGTSGEWTDIYVFDKAINVIYSVSNMEE